MSDAAGIIRWADGWQVAWQWPPVVVVVLAALAVVTAMLGQVGWRTILARVGLIGMLVMMLAGISWSPAVPATGQGGAEAAPRLLGIELPAVAWQGEQVDVRVTGLVPRGVPTAGTLRVDLRDADGAAVVSGLLHPVDPSAIRPSEGDDASWMRVVGILPWRPRDNGLQRLTASFAAAGASAGNVVSASCGVTDEPLRVLMIDTAARWETRHIAAALRRAVGIDVDVVFLGTGVAHRVPLTRADYRGYDAVVLGVIDPRDLPVAAADAMAAAVRDDGVGLVWAIDGRIDLAAVALGGLGALLPCRAVGGPVAEAATTRLQVQPTPAAAGFPWIMPLTDWVAQPAAAVYLPVVTTISRPTAITVLALAETASVTPALLVDRVDSGRVLTALVETWRWRAGGHAAAVDSFWQDALRFVAEPRLRARFAELSSLPDQSGQSVEEARPPTPPWRDSGSVSPTAPGVRWNHPLLVVILVLVAAAGWWLAGREPKRFGEGMKRDGTNDVGRGG